MPQIKRKIVSIWKQGLTSRGHAEDYWIVLECGHVHVTSYSIGIHLKEFALSQNMSPVMRCRDCEQSKPVSVELLEKYTPYRIWREQNFKRFKKEETEEEDENDA